MFIFDVLLHRRHWGLSRWRLVRLPPLRDRGQRPRPLSPRCTYGVVAARRSPMRKTFQQRTYHNRVPAWHLRMVMWRCYWSPWRCTAGVTPASTRRPAAGRQRAALRREGDGTRSRGLISPSRRMFSTAPVGVYPLVPTRFHRVTSESTSAHQRPACACGQKTILRTPGGGLPRYCAPQEVQSGPLVPSAADWRSPKSGDHEDDGRPGYPKRSR